MNTEKTLEIPSASYETTVLLAASIGGKLRGDEVIELKSDLGGGKTAFVTGLAQGMGCEEVVNSPSFTLNNIYHGPRGVMNHYDLYRLQDPGIMAHEIAEAINDSNTVVAVEWADTVADVLPPDRLIVNLEVVSENERMITLVYPEKMSYLVEDVA